MNDSTAHDLIPTEVGEEHRRRFTVGAFLASYKSDETRKAYRRDLNAWHEFADRYGFDPIRQATRTHIEIFLREQESRYAKATVCRRMSGVASYYDWLVGEDWIGESPCDRVRRPRPPDWQPRPYLNRMELKDWLTVAAGEGGTVHAAACLLGLHGLRVGEVVGADVDDLVEDRFEAKLLLPRRKGDRSGEIILDRRTSRAIDRALDGRTAGPILTNREGRRCSRQTVATIVERLARNARIDKKVTPHTLRRSVATLLLEAGVPISEVQRLLGHSKADTTIRYDQRHQQPSNAALTLVAMTS